MSKLQILGCSAIKARPIKKWAQVKDARCQVKLDECEDIVSAVDSFVNGLIQYRRETIDNWSTPQETLDRGYGDCEDFALLKRAILLNHGYADEDIMFLIVNDLIGRTQHAVLVVEGRLLDNFNSLTLPMEEVIDYIPITGCAGENGYIFGRPTTLDR